MFVGVCACVGVDVDMRACVCEHMCGRTIMCVVLYVYYVHTVRGPGRSLHTIILFFFLYSAVWAFSRSLFRCCVGVDYDVGVYSQETTAQVRFRL